MGSLLGLLRSRVTTVRHAAVEALGRLEDPKAATRLIAFIDNGSEETVIRYAALEALGKIVRRVSLPEEGIEGETEEALCAALADPSPLIRATAAKVIGLLGLSELASDLENVLKDASVHVRWQATQALGRAGTRASLTPLRGMLADEQVVFGRKISTLAWRAMAWTALREVARAGNSGLRALGTHLRRWAKRVGQGTSACLRVLWSHLRRGTEEAARAARPHLHALWSCLGRGMEKSRRAVGPHSHALWNRLKQRVKKAIRPDRDVSA